MPGFLDMKWIKFAQRLLVCGSFISCCLRPRWSLKTNSIIDTPT